MKKKPTPARKSAPTPELPKPAPIVLTPDDFNSNRGTERGLGFLEQSIELFGAARSVVADADGIIRAGNKTWEICKQKGIPVKIVESDGRSLIVVKRTDLRGDRAIEYGVVDNRVGQVSLDYDTDVLKALIEDGLDLSRWWMADELAALLGGAEDEKQGSVAGLTEPDALPPARKTTIKRGDMFELGRHRILCGDTTDRADVLKLVGAETLVMLHADPPYGMGKEADGIANDNLYGANLDAFQMKWWNAWVPSLSENGSAYVWGNAPDLWRLWYTGGLESPDWMVRNEIAWDKGTAFGMTSDGAHSYPPATERCLFLMRGEQFLGNQNKEDFWPGYEPLRAWLEAEREKAGWTNADVNKATATQMAGHWFSQSQFQPISEKHYEALRTAAAGRAFAESYQALFDRMFPGIKDGGNAHRRDLSAAMRETRSYFDNAHDSMTDVWKFPRVVGEERYGHATPKPVAMISRAVKSSSPEDGIIGVPFGGTAPELIAAEQHGRAVRVMEIEPEYVQVAIDRWESFTGKTARLLF